jgi:hypothetical protein
MLSPVQRQWLLDAGARITVCGNSDGAKRLGDANPLHGVTLRTSAWQTSTLQPF